MSSGAAIISNNKKRDIFDIINDIIENTTLVKLMHIIGNINRTVSIYDIWIYDSNDKKPILLVK